MAWNDILGSDAITPISLALMRMGGRSNRPRNLGEELTVAMQQYGQMQEAKQQAKMRDLQMEQVKQALMKAKKQEGLADQLANLRPQFMKPAVPGEPERQVFNTPLFAQEGGNPIPEMPTLTGGMADVLAKYPVPQQPQPQLDLSARTIPAVPGQPASFDREGYMNAALPILDQMKPGTSIEYEMEKQKAELARQGKIDEIKLKLADAATSRQEKADLARELARMQIEGRQDLAEFTATIARGNQAVSPVKVMENGKVVVKDARTGRIIGDAPTGGQNLSATAQKELFEADDVVNAGNNAVQVLESILAKDPKTQKSQNDIAWEGGSAKARVIGQSFIPGKYPGADAAVDLENKVTGQALDQLKTIFGAMPTEGERKVLIDLQGSINLKANQRELIYQRAIDMAKKRIKINKEKADRIRKGTFFSDGGNESSGGWSDL